MKACFPNVYEQVAKHRSVLRALLSNRMKPGQTVFEATQCDPDLWITMQKRLGRQAAYSFDDGLSVFVDALASSVRESIRTGVSVERICPESLVADFSDGWEQGFCLAMSSR